MNIILIGPVSGDVERAHDLFMQLEEEFVVSGDDVVHNPMRDHEGGHSEAWYMKKSLASICDLVEAKTPELLAVVLAGWEKSDGSKAEVALCKKLGIQIFNEPVNGGDVWIQAKRYEVLRKMNPNQFCSIYQINIRGVFQFDEIIDKIIDGSIKMQDNGSWEFGV